MTVCIGALCASVMDLPSPLRHKFTEMLTSVLLCSTVTLIISLCARNYWLLGLMLIVVTFLASMMVVYGRKTMPLQFSVLLAMTLSMANGLAASHAFFHSALFLTGGLVYLAYAMAVSWFLRRRTKQQVLAEALFALARYIRIKADFYDTRVSSNDHFNLLVRQQIELADRQEAARDLILRGHQNELDAVLLQVHSGTLDMYELILSTCTDYAVLRQHFADADVLISLGGLVRKIARDIESIAFALTRNRASVANSGYDGELQAIRAVLQLLEQKNCRYAHSEAVIALRASYNKARAAIDMMGQLHLATQTMVRPLAAFAGADMTVFLTRQKYGPRLLVSNLHWKSPVFRFALRVAMAVAVGLMVTQQLSYASHGYWILLTIIIILKPSFSMTKRRRGDRLIGTVVGCVVTAVILHFIHQPIALFGFLFVATVAVPAFVYIKYRYTAIAASMQILLQFSLLLPSSTHLINERLIDTAAGVAIASLFSFVLPSWEYRALPQLIRNVLRQNQRYIEASRGLLQAEVADDFIYRLCRKRIMDCLAELGAALVRMLDEPVSKHRSVEDINQFIARNYLVVAHVAAIRLLLRSHPEGLPEASVDVERACDRVRDTLAQALQSLERPAPPIEQPEMVTDPRHTCALSEKETWPARRLLQRHIGLLQADAADIAVRSVTIDRILRLHD
ncbi:FUSC family membrane protein [Undibacterium arcticum]|uniref:FUSC family membrane protein n=2 Tax=Undibacterium arcticum TaxID=1762892 RepID=A0ABV7EXW5_9BURK